MISGNSCPASLPIGNGCAIWVRFTPVAVGSATGTLTITAGGGSQIVTLSGTGVAGPITINTTPLTFPATTVGQGSSSMTVSILNQSGSPITVTPSITANFTISGNNCPASLPNANGCTIWVRFAPQTVGTLTGVLTINAGGTIGIVNLSGTGVAGPITINPTSLVFPATTVGLGSSSKTTTIFNQSGLPITVTPSTTGDFIVSGNTCPALLPSGTGCMIWVRFTPKSVGTLTGVLTISPGGTIGTVNLSGTGQ
jgi:hypothetical protein